MTQYQAALHPTRRNRPTPRSLAAVLGALLLALFLSACGQTPTTTTTPTPKPGVNSVAIDGGNFSLAEHAATTLTATVSVTGSASKAVVWSSSNSAVASIDPDSGEVTATGAAGQTAQITATSIANTTVSDTVTITVNAGPTAVVSVDIDGGDFALHVGTSEVLTATVVVTGDASTALTWTSDDGAVATVGASTGEVTATGTAGQTAQITATSVFDATVSDTVTVTLTATPPTSISDLTATIVLGSQVELAWTAVNANTFDVVCDDGAGGTEVTLQSALAGSATGTTVAIPASDCLTIRVYARGTGADDDVETALTGVVLNGNDIGPGSLRNVIASAASGSTIGFASDVTEVVLGVLQYLLTHDAHLVLHDKTLTISGPAGSPVTVRGDDTLPVDSEGIPVFNSRMIYVSPTATVRLDGLVISGGTFIGLGGGVRNDGDLTITNATLENNRAWYRGGGVYNLGTLLIQDSTIQNNRAEVTDAEFDAGFACIDDVDRSCGPKDDVYVGLSEGGQAGGDGGGLYNDGTAQIVNSTLDGNTAVYSGGGIYVGAGSVEVTGSIINDNTASDASVTSFTTYSYGGGVANFVDSGFTMTGGSITNNTSANIGGGIANGSNIVPDLAMTLTDVSVTTNTAAEYGGGFIHYYDTDVPPNYSLELLGTTSVTGNTANVSGNNAFYNDINASSLLAPASVKGHVELGGSDDR